MAGGDAFNGFDSKAGSVSRLKRCNACAKLRSMIQNFGLINRKPI
jgi:hypothetical protein